MLVATKARFAAGEGWPAVPDVFHDAELARRYRALMRHLARELKQMPMLAGIEPMSEPRNKVVPQSAVRQFYEGACATIGEIDSRMPCIVGPAPYYKVWQLNASLLLRSAGGARKGRRARTRKPGRCAPSCWPDVDVGLAPARSLLDTVVCGVLTCLLACLLACLPTYYPTH